jgi:hypothetical protein
MLKNGFFRNSRKTRKHENPKNGPFTRVAWRVRHTRLKSSTKPFQILQQNTQIERNNDVSVAGQGTWQPGKKIAPTNPDTSQNQTADQTIKCKPTNQKEAGIVAHAPQRNHFHPGFGPQKGSAVACAPHYLQYQAFWGLLVPHWP